MTWHYRAPQRYEFDTEEEYEEACRNYEDAESDYIEAYEERYRG